MSGYVKKIAVIKQVKGGFSADGGVISGLVKAETYAGFLKVEASLINFAPLTEGRYVLGISDGLNTVTFEGLTFEGESDINLSLGFAFLVCFVRDGVAPIASASCGQMACALPDLKEEMTRRENIKPKSAGAAYDDEAITEVNYYEYDTAQSGAAVRAAEKQEKKGSAGNENEEAPRAVQGKKKRRVTDERAETEDEPARPELAGGDFYSRMKGDIDKIFRTYPRERAIESVMEGSKFARITYGDGKYYVFGVLSVEGKPRYICYGVPSDNTHTPPPSLKELAGFIPTGENRGFWVTYQDAATGVSVKLAAE